jgi:hypothetical protein
LLAGNFLHTSSNLFCCKSVFEEVGLFRSLRYVHDYDFFLRLGAQCQMVVLEDALLKYRFHESNTLGQDYAVSNFETGLVLADFFLRHDLSSLLPGYAEPGDVLARFFNSLRSYDTDREILTLLLLGRMHGTPAGLLPAVAGEAGAAFRQACTAAQKTGRDLALCAEELRWHKRQSESWWRKAQEATEALKWQKDQTDRWWREAEEQKEHLQWQAGQTTLWWRRAQDLDSLAKRQEGRIGALPSEAAALRSEADGLRSEADGLRMQLAEILSSRRWRMATRLATLVHKVMPPGSRCATWLRTLVR